MSKPDDDQDLLRDDELWGDFSYSFTEAQRQARATFIARGLHLPRAWLARGRDSIDADPAGRLATSIFSTVTESGCTDPRYPKDWNADDWRINPSFKGIIKHGGDAYLWALIRIAIDESLADTDEIPETLEAEGFIVRLPRRRPAGPPRKAGGADGKRSSGRFPRREKDFYPTPAKAVKPLIPFLHRDGIRSFAEPCVGAGDLVRGLERFGFTCGYQGDIATGQDALAGTDFGEVDVVVTNPPFSLLVPMIEHFQKIKPTWLFGELDWTANVYFAPFLNSTCSDVVPVGRLRLIAGSEHDSGMSSFVWLRFDRAHTGTTIIHPRGSDGVSTPIDPMDGAELMRREIAYFTRYGEEAYCGLCVPYPGVDLARSPAKAPKPKPNGERPALTQGNLFEEHP